MGLRIENFGIRDFNRDVNDSGNLDDKYHRWAAYRRAVGEFVCKADEGGKSIVVFSAGECNDINLTALTKAFRRVVLTDVDEAGIRNGVKRQKPHGQRRIEIAAAEYTGLERVRFFETLGQLMAGAAPVREVCEFVSNAFSSVMPPDLAADLGRFDLVLSCPVYTQLAFSQAEVLMKGLEAMELYTSDELNQLKTYICKETAVLIGKYNDLLFSMVQPGGRVVVLTDVVEVQNDPALKAQILDALAGETNAIRLEELVSAHGLPLAKTGRKDLCRKMDFRYTFWAHWPMDEYKDYLVWGAAGERAQIVNK